MSETRAPRRIRRVTNEPIVERADAEAALAARAEVGSELEPHVVDAFVDRIEKRLDDRVARELEARTKTADQRGMSFVVALVSLGVGIPITAIALGSGLPALAIAWLGIVLVNAVFARMS